MFLLFFYFFAYITAEKNIAGEGKASQSNNYSSKYGLARVAIDGNKDGRWGSRSVTHTSKTGKAAW